MNQKQLYILSIVLIILLCTHNARGQSISPSTINSTGGTATIGGNDYDYSVAEMTMVSTFTAGSVIITQGVLQPADTAVTPPASIIKTNLANNLLVFPNPASTVLNLQYTSAEQGLLSYRLMDLAGKVIMNNSTEIKQGVTFEQLNITSIAAATYMLEVSFKGIDNNEAATTYKIEKLK